MKPETRRENSLIVLETAATIINPPIAVVKQSELNCHLNAIWEIIIAGSGIWQSTRQQLLNIPYECTQYTTL